MTSECLSLSPVAKTYTNAECLAYMNAVASEHETELFARIRRERPDIDLSDHQLQYLQKQFISGFQRKKSKNGRGIEDLISELLTSHHIPFRTQVTIDKNGRIVGDKQKRDKCHHIVDFVIGDFDCGIVIQCNDGIVLFPLDFLHMRDVGVEVGFQCTLDSFIRSKYFLRLKPRFSRLTVFANCIQRHIRWNAFFGGILLNNILCGRFKVEFHV